MTRGTDEVTAMPVTVSSMSRPSRSSSWVSSRACSSAVRTSTVDSRQWWARPTGSVPSRGTDSSTGRRRVVGEQPDDGLGVPHVDGEQHGGPFLGGAALGAAVRCRLSAQVEAEVEHRGRVGEGTGRQQVGTGGGQGRGRLEGDPAGHLDQGVRTRRPAPRRRPRPPGPGPCCRAGRRWRRRPPPRPPGPSRSHSTSTIRPGHWRRARATASAMVAPPRWLSLTSTASDRLPRWLTPPPARTAAFSSARSPGWSCGCRAPGWPGWPPGTAST